MDVDALLAEMDDALDGSADGQRCTAGVTRSSRPEAPKSAATTQKRYQAEEKTPPATQTVSRVSAASPSPQAVNNSRCGAPLPASTKAEDRLDSLLSSMDDAMHPAAAPPASSPPLLTSASASTGSRVAAQPRPPLVSCSAGTQAAPQQHHCSAVVLSSNAASACSHLLCLSCEHGVMSIPSFSFLPTADYLFLRTNVPSVAQLQQRMTPASHATAYCCQCAYVNCSSSSQRIDRNIRWICSGHSS